VLAHQTPSCSILVVLNALSVFHPPHACDRERCTSRINMLNCSHYRQQVALWAYLMELHLLVTPAVCMCARLNVFPMFSVFCSSRFTGKHFTAIWLKRVNNWNLWHGQGDLTVSDRDIASSLHQDGTTIGPRNNPTQAQLPYKGFIHTTTQVCCTCKGLKIMWGLFSALSSMCVF